MEIAILLLGLMLGALSAGQGSGRVSLDGRVMASPEEVTRCWLIGAHSLGLGIGLVGLIAITSRGLESWALRQGVTPRGGTA